MKIKLRPEDPGPPGTSEWSEMNDWLANLRENADGEPDAPFGPSSTEEAYGPAPQADHAIAEAYGAPVLGDGQEAGVAADPAVPAEVAEPVAADEIIFGDVTAGASEIAGASVAGVDLTGVDVAGVDAAGVDAAGVDAAGVDVAGVAAPEPVATATVASQTVAPGTVAPGTVAPGTVAPEPAAEDETASVRALIGDELRTPTVWCELNPGNCISWHADRAALGVADVRARAIAVGWRIDALGRLTCPQCQQRSTSFRATHQVVRWNRAYALTMAARQAARQGGYPYPQPAFYPR
jgi:hypothetical protein